MGLRKGLIYFDTQIGDSVMILVLVTPVYRVEQASKRLWPHASAHRAVLIVPATSRDGDRMSAILSTLT